jgi:hypothetical protein
MINSKETELIILFLVFDVWYLVIKLQDRSQNFSCGSIPEKIDAQTFYLTADRDGGYPVGNPAWPMNIWLRSTIISAPGLQRPKAIKKALNSKTT